MGENRAERKRKERLQQKQNSVYEKLTPVEQQLLVDWTNERVENTWQVVEEVLTKTMRVNRISQNRIDKIFKEFREDTEKNFKEVI